MIYTFQHVPRVNRCIECLSVVHANTHLMKRPNDLCLVTRAATKKRAGISYIRKPFLFFLQSSSLATLFSLRSQQRMRNYRNFYLRPSPGQKRMRNYGKERKSLNTKQAGKLMFLSYTTFSLFSVSLLTNEQTNCFIFSLRQLLFTSSTSSCY